MLSIFKREIKANLKPLLFWSIGILVLILVGFYKYSSIANAQGGSINAMFEMMPRIIKVLFGMGSLSLDTPEGFYACMFVWICFIVFAHAVMLGTGIIIKEERDKTADFLFTKPVRRQKILIGKALAAMFNSLILAIVVWASTAAVFLPQLTESFFYELNITMLGMLITQLVFLFIGFICAAAVKSYRKAPQLSILILIITYFISVILEMSGQLDFLYFLSPFRYFNAVEVMTEGFSWTYVLVSAVIMAVTGLLSLRMFSARNLGS